MILSIDSNDANSAPLHKKTISSLSGAVESMMKKLEDVGVLVARILMPILFITAGWGKITGYAGTQQYMEAMGVPGFMLPLVILLEFGGGLAILKNICHRKLFVWYHKYQNNSFLGYE